jgi:hypothetical protein
MQVTQPTNSATGDHTFLLLATETRKAIYLRRTPSFSTATLRGPTIQVTNMMIILGRIRCITNLHSPQGTRTTNQHSWHLRRRLYGSTATSSSLPEICIGVVCAVSPCIVFTCSLKQLLIPRRCWPRQVRHQHARFVEHFSPCHLKAPHG